MAEGHAPITERLVVALVRGVHGLHGAVRMETLTDRPEARFVPGAVLYREGSDVALTIASAEAVQDGPGWRVRFREVTTRDAADGLRDAYLETAIRPDADLARGEVYWHEVVGVTVRGVDGTDLGTVQDIYRVAENEVYVVGGGPFGTFDLPAVRAFIRIFAPRRGEIVIDADALDLQPPKVRPTGDDRPKAPRRTSRKRRPAADGAAADGAAAAEPPPEPA
ncbi:MAG: ribosome maturation factor RimM [Candidatus Limnocylindrales bacterium]